ncbi:MAG: amino acid permease [Alphaproteobacteria bacterium]|jgi:amino acid transporter|nr:amino acid permease [Alphaproteobacteria bacterium]MDP6814667.1 amino acid permease [Alphaproteobacteria bacterium]
MRPKLKRSLSLPLLTLYGLGTTVGAGIYVLLGKVAGAAGPLAPVSFIVAGALAALTAFSFAEWAGRLPKSAGEAVYVDAGLRWRGMAIVVGLAVAASGIVSAAAISVGASGYLQQFLPLPRPALIVLAVLVLGAIAAWGIGESVRIAALFTVVEVAGLVLVIWAGGLAIDDLPAALGRLTEASWSDAWLGVWAGSVLAFFAFIGFEDMVNVAEEVKDVARAMPRAIILTLAVTGLLYVMVATVAVLAVPPRELAASGAPLAVIYQAGIGGSPLLIVAIASVGTLNGALIQVIMASRVLYGLSQQGWLPAFLGTVHARTRTPLLATGLAAGLVLLLALAFPIEALAEATSLIVLSIFTLVNLALWRLKRRGDGPPPLGLVVPEWLPLVGFLVSGFFAGAELLRLLGGLV